MRYFCCLLILLLQGCAPVKNQGFIKGTILMQPDVSISEIEVTVGDWLIYQNRRMAIEGNSVFAKLLPDSNAIAPVVYRYLLTEAKNFPRPDFDLFSLRCVNHANNHFSLCPLALYPITGLTWQQAADYCEWRTKYEGGSQYRFVLPSIEDWRRFAAHSLKPNRRFPNDSICKDTCKLFSYRYTKHGPHGIQQVGQFRPVEHGKLYDVFGNVSEMTATPGVGVGGNFNLFARQCSLDSVQIFNKPEPWLGFRFWIVKSNG